MKILSIRQRSGFLRTLQVDLHRALLSWRFLLTIGLILAWLIMNGATYIFIYQFLYSTGIPVIFDEAITGRSGLGMIVLSLATIPYSTSYLTDTSSGFVHHATHRAGFTAYAFARVISVAISAFLAMVIAAGIFLAGLCLTGAPINAIPGNGTTFNGVYTDLVIQVGPWCYFLVRFTLSGLTAAMAAVFGLYSTTLIPNAYVALVTPLILYYSWDAIITVLFTLTGGVLQYTSYFAMINNIMLQPTRYNGFSFIWTSVFLLTLTALWGRGFILRLRKEQGL